jgi:Ca2+-binding EF-hand superfamily protein
MVSAIKSHKNIDQEQNQKNGNIFYKYSEEEIENFRCIFEMFDKEKQGFIEIVDLQTIMRSLGRDPNEAMELLQSL